MNLGDTWTIKETGGRWRPGPRDDLSGDATADATIYVVFLVLTDATTLVLGSPTSGPLASGVLGGTGA